MHPVLLILKAKLAAAEAALRHSKFVDEHQKSLAASHPAQYLPAVHAEAMASNVQGIYTHFEAILKTITNSIDGYTPAGDASHRDILLLASTPSEHRPAVIGAQTQTGLLRLLGFRHAVRNNYASELRHPEVFENVGLLNVIAPLFFADLEAFIASFEDAEGDQSKVKDGPK